MNKKSNLFTAAFVSVAAVWVGGHIGPGFATGSSLKVFFLTYGASALFLPFLSMAITAVVMYLMAEYSRRHKAYNYKDYVRCLYGEKGSKIAIPIYDISFLCTVICAGGTCTSGLASLLEQHFGLNYWVSVVLMVVVTIFLCLYGSKLLGRASAVMMYLILGVVILIFVMSFAFGDYDIAGAFANSAANAKVPSFSTALRKAILYGGLQTSIIFNVMSVGDLLASKKDTQKAIGFGYAVNCVLLFFGALMLFSYTNVYDVVGQTLPFYSVLDRLGFSWLVWLYILLMTLAVLTSLAGLAFAGATRFDKAFTFIENARTRKIVIIVLMLGLAAGAAGFGLNKIMSVGNSINGYLSIAILAVPAIFVVLPRMRKEDAEAENNK